MTLTKPILFFIIGISIVIVVVLVNQLVNYAFHYETAGSNDMDYVDGSDLGLKVICDRELFVKPTNCRYTEEGQQTYDYFYPYFVNIKP